MRYFVKLDELEQTGNDLLNYQKNEIINKIDELNECIKSFEWNGIGHDSFINVYQIEINKLRNLAAKLEKIGDFILYFKDHYYETNEKMGFSWDEYLDEIESRNKYGV